MSQGWKRPLRLAGVCWVLFAVVLVAAYWIPFVKWADGWSVAGFLSLQSPTANWFAVRTAKLADPVPFAVWTILLASIALYRGRPRHALGAIVLLAGASILAQTLKLILAHPRPHGFLGHAQLGSDAFPSGHATASMSLALAAVIVAPAAWRGIVAIAGALFALAVAESVMLLAWHYPSDVAGGFLVATASALMTIAALRAADERWPERTGREAALRALGDLDARRAGVVVAGFVLAALAGVTIAAGPEARSFIDRHTVAVVAAAAVAAMAAVLPAAVVSLGARHR